MKPKKIIPPSHEERLKEAKEEIELSINAYQNLRDQCEHKRKVWKDKYGGYYCEVCEKFLPKVVLKDTEAYNNFLSFEHKHSAIFGIFKRLSEDEKKEILRRLESKEKPTEREYLKEKYLKGLKDDEYHFEQGG